MISPDQLASLLDDALDAEARASLEGQLESDATSLQFVLEQREMDRALRSLLGSPARRARLKDSILAAVAGPSSAKLRQQVLAATSGRPVRTHGAPGWLHSLRTRFGEIFQPRRQAGWGWSPAAALVLVLAVGVWLLFRPAPEVGVVIGQFGVVVGEPELVQAGRPGAFKAQPKTPVQLGDRIETGDADKAEIVFKDGTTLRLDFNTIVQVLDLKGAVRNPRAMLLRPPQIDLQRGQIWTKVQKLTNAPQYAIRTEAATAVARGTEFGVKVQKAGSTNALRATAILTVKEGLVDFSNAQGSVQATAMTESIATTDAAPSQPIPLKTIKVFVAGDKLISYSGQLPGIELQEPSFSIVYPQGWAGLEVRAIEDPGDNGGRQFRIVRIWPRSPAEKAGLMLGDMISQVNGRAVTNLQQVLSAVVQRRGATVSLGVLRGGAVNTVSFVTTAHPDAPPIREMPAALAQDVFDSTWPLIEAGFQDVITPVQWQELEQQFQGLLARHPDCAAAYNNRGAWHEANGQVGSAIRQVRRAIAIEPNNPVYHYNLSRLLRSIGNFERGVEEAEAVVNVEPNWERGIASLAHAYSLLGRHEDAIAALERGLAVSPACAELWAAKSSALVFLQKPEEAQIAALKAVELDPANAARLLQLALVYWASGETAKGEAASRKAIEIDPGDARAYASLAVDIIGRLGSRLPEDVTDAQPQELAIDLWQNRPAEELAIIDESERLIRKAIALKPNTANDHVTLINILLLHGAVDEAEQVLGKVVELDPNRPSADAYNALAYRFAVWGIRLDEALQFAEHAVQIAQEAYIFDTLATVHFRRGEWDQAEAAWKKCLDLAGAQVDPSCWFHLGKVYERKNQIPKAVEAYREALRLRPDYPEASRALAKLRQ